LEYQVVAAARLMSNSACLLSYPFLAVQLALALAQQVASLVQEA
jgi:hypothetical protein